MNITEIPTETTTGSPDRNLLFSAIAASFTVLLYAYLLFSVLPPAQLDKYPEAVSLFLRNELAAYRLVDFSFLYFYLHLILQKISSNPGVIVSWTHIFFAGASVFLFSRILLKFFSFPVAVAGTLIFLLERSLIEYHQVFEPEPLVIFFLIAFLFFIHRPGTGNHLVAGACFGLGLLTRPNFFPVFFLAVLYLLLNRVGRRSILLFTLPVVLCLSLLLARNTRILGCFSPFFMNPGTVLFEGNNPYSKGLSSIYPPLFDDVWTGKYPDYHHELYRLFARTSTGKQFTIAEVNAYWLQKSLHFLRDHPRHAFRLFRTKLFHSFHDYQWHDVANGYWNEQKLKEENIPTVPFAVLASLAVAGVLLRAKDWRSLLIFYGVLFSQLLSMILIYTSVRQRVSIVCIFVFFACAALQHLFTVKRRRAILLAASLSVLSLLLYRRSDLMREEDHLWKNIRLSNRVYQEAMAKRNEGKISEAARLNALSLAVAPWNIESRRLSNLPFEPDGWIADALKYRSPDDFSSRFDRAVLLIEAGRAKEAQAILLQLLLQSHHLKRDYYQSSEIYFYLGRIQEIAGNMLRAQELFSRGLTRSPGDPEILAHLTVLTNQEYFRNRLFRYFDDIDAHFFLGKAALQCGKPEIAVKSFSFIAQNIPNFRRARIYLSASMAAAGSLQKAAEEYQEALRLRPEPLLLESEILILFRRLYQSNPKNAYAYGIILRQFGHFRESLEIQKKALEATPENTAIAAEIKALQKALEQTGS